MVDQTLSEEIRARVARTAREATVERLALVSSLIWSLGALLFYVFVMYPLDVKPSIGMLGGLALLVPAALPWIAYPRLVQKNVANRLESELSRRPGESSMIARSL